MKYIVIPNPATDAFEAVLFCESLAHRAVAGGHTVLSAGFCNQAGEVWGHSEGLGVSSRPQDAALVKVALTISMNPSRRFP